ncbi:hypothetical protein RFH42_16270 [Acinetobacter rudis]|uniref:hypothetical protein n=1 Tax=Acinetobacter rudis TaxID=632955 RepID=UPI00280F64F4|nr:hypothetical protein [Acinetobacter rudis]MDQ8954506.1 hypothetical protein [Acinetobacter rudis]
MDIQKEHGREAFEEFEFQKRPFASKKVLFQKYDPARIGDCDGNEGKYYCAEMQEKWEIWQHVAQAIPKGFVLVPKESLKIALLWMDEDIDPWQMGGDSFAQLYEHKPILEKAMLEAAEGN